MTKEVEPSAVDVCRWRGVGLRLWRQGFKEQSVVGVEAKGEDNKGSGDGTMPSEGSCEPGGYKISCT